MTANVGPADRVIRLALGGLLILWALIAGGWTPLAWGALAVGAVLLLTGAVRLCPLYGLLGISTCPVGR